jgi:DNA-directed RNA polymerase subunit RPC12/RpoP
MTHKTREELREKGYEAVTCPKCRSIFTYTVTVDGQLFYRCHGCGHTFDDDELGGAK